MVAAIVAWAGAFVVAADPSGRDGGVGLLPAPVLTAPAFEPGVLIGLAVPLFVVTMASQNVTGMTVLATHGYRPRLPRILAPARRWVAALAAGVSYLVLGLGAGLIAAFALAAADEAHRDAAVVRASGIAPLGISAPFWGLVAGLALLAVQHRRAAA